MISEMNQKALLEFVNISKEEFNAAAQTFDSRTYQQVAELIWNAEENGNRVHITGIGKPSHVAAYIASLFSSIGTPTYFLHGTEAVHGSSGQLVPGDVVICISNSGETQELKETVKAAKKNGCKIIAVTGNPDSWLARESEACLLAGVTQEGGPLNRAPRASILAEIFVLQGLSVILQTAKGITPKDYLKWHPGGTLGSLRENEK